MIGKRISPVLEQIENDLWMFEANEMTKPEYTLEGFRAATKIFMSALMDRTWNLQENENMDFQDRIKMVAKAGQDVRALVKTYTNIDTKELY